MRRLLPALLAAAALAACGGEEPDRVAVTLYAAGPPGERRPAVEALQRVIAERGGLAGRYRVTLNWIGVPRDAPRSAILDAARRAVEDPRALAFVDAGTGAPLDVVALLNEAGVPVANVADPRLRAAFCAGRDPYPSGRRTAVAPRGPDPGDRAAAVADALFEALEPMGAEFDRDAVTRALLARFGGCPRAGRRVAPAS